MISVMNSDDSVLKIRNATDRTLIRRFRAGEQDAASELYLRYAKRLQGLAKNQTSTELAVRKGADDIIQSVFRTFFRRVSVGQYDVIEGEDLWRLFMVIALNKIRNAAEFHRAKKRDVRKTKSVDSDLYRTFSTHEKDEHVAIVVLQLTIDNIVSGMPGQSRELVQLRMEGYSVAEIATKTKRAQRSVERVLQKFRQILLTEIEQGDET